MNWFRKLRLCFRALTQKEPLDARMEEELCSHIEIHTQANIDAGMPPEESWSQEKLMSKLQNQGWNICRQLFPLSKSCRSMLLRRLRCACVR
jgi:hypothetical protein